MAVYTLGPLLGPSFGPVAGGFIAETIGFKWIFIVIAIASGVGGVIGTLVLEETFAPVIRIRRARREIKKTGVKTMEHDVLLEQHLDYKHVLWVNMTRPFALLFGSFICFILSLYMGM
jgi:MFS family permease